MRKCVVVLWVLLILPLLTEGADLGGQLNQLLEAQEPAEQEKILESILKGRPSADTLMSLIKSIEFDKPEKRGVVRSENLCLDGVRRPFCWYVPQSYDPAKRASLLVCLHGGVSRPEIIEEPEKYVQESSYVQLAEESGYILLVPFGQDGATWWDSVGVANVLSQIRTTKRKFNIDDNRVYMTGFSDGASGSFFFAMCHPTDFAGFLPLNGHPGVGSIDGEIQTYFVNLSNRALSVVNTDLDALYPDKAIRPIMELARRAGANILYRIHTGIGHSFDYAPQEMPLMAKFMEAHARAVSSPSVKWETAYQTLGRCDWLSVDRVKADGHADWYEDHNMELVDDRVMFGFIAEDKYEGPGVKIAEVVGDSSLCALLAMKPGDVVLELEDSKVNSRDDVTAYKETKSRGDSTKIKILRDGEQLELVGRFPEPDTFDLFRRELPSARAEASFCGNRFSVKGSQLGAFTIYIHPDMVQLDQNVVIEANGETVFDGKVEADPEFILRNFLRNRDRELTYVNKVSMDLTE